MANRRDLLVQIESQFSDGGFKSAEASAKALVRELDKVERAERSLAAMQMAATREDEARTARRLAAMQQFGQGSLLMGAALAAGLGMAAKSARDWETAWTGVTKTVDGSADEMARLEGELRGLTKTLPATHAEIAAVAEAAGQLGVRRSDIASFTRTMIDLGETTNLTADDAATALAKLGNVMGVLPSQAQRAGSALVALGNDGASTERDIVEMSLRIAGAGKTIGLSEAQVMGFAAALSSVGIEAEAGGSAISRVMVDIAQSVDAGGGKLQKFANVAGMSAAEFTTAFRTNAADAVTSFIEGLGRMQKSGQSVFGTLESLELGEIRVRDALLRTANAGDIVRKSVDLGSAAWEQNTALVTEASKRYETAESRIAVARNRLNEMAIDVGGVVLPAIAGAAEQVGVLADLFGELPAPIRSAVTVLGMAATVIALAGGAASIAVPKFVALRASLDTLGPRGAAVSRGLGSVVSVLGGPWGMALAAATVGLGIFASRQAESKGRVQELTATLDAQTGAITDNTRAVVAKRLLDEDVLDLARQMGISLGDVTDAALGQADAMQRVNEQAKAWAATEGYDAAAQSAALLAQKMGGVAAEVTAAGEAQKQLADATGGAAGATKAAAAEATVMAGAADRAAGAVRDLATANDEQRDAVLGARDANRDYEAALDGLSESIKDNGKTLDVGTAKGRANEAAMDALAKSAVDAAKAQLQQGDSVESAAATMQRRRGEFVALATQLLKDGAAAEQLADKLGLTKGKVGELATAITQTPSSKVITFTVDADRARAEIAQLRNLAQIRATIRYDVMDRAAPAAANGLLTMNGVTKMADGGIRDGGIMARQRPILWNEAPGGEAYIPLDPAKRSRSLDLWAETGRMLGVSTTTAPYTPESGLTNSLAGIRVTGTLDTPWGPAQISGIVRDELTAQARAVARKRR